MRPIWLIVLSNWLGVRPNAGFVPARSKSAYSSQECHRCHYVARENRPNQQTFCCVVGGHTNHADRNAAENLARRLGDQELAVCADRQAIKSVLDRRHQEWKVRNGWP
ncbi:MAG TPA: zinc ribbon domain-containing protein [Ktedonobacterales bacterium]|nr:zinc ribbon domain-containing protein [Ktedonobacterales bacterium]